MLSKRLKYLNSGIREYCEHYSGHLVNLNLENTFNFEIIPKDLS